MSIFPKRTIPGSQVTIHWNLSVPPQLQQHSCPFVRIGVTDPAGNTTMLLEEYIPVLPSVGSTLPVEDTGEKSLLYLNKNTPLLLLAAYLSGRRQREKLVEILQNIQSGRHYYFTYPVPADARPGKYTLLSEIHVDGITKYSGTAADDFFLVEKIGVENMVQAGLPLVALITNYSPETTPIKILRYQPGRPVLPADVQVIELPGNSSREVVVTSPDLFLCYNEERVLVPLYALQQSRSIRNQQLLYTCKKENEEEVVYVLHKEEDTGYRLTGQQREIWLKADGLISREQIVAGNEDVYNEMLASGLIIELK